MIHGGDIYSLKDNNGQYPIDFSANINPLGLPKSVKTAILGGLESLTSYPDVRCRELTLAVSEFEGVKKEHLLFGNGAADIIFRLAYALKPKTALLLAPTFAEYELALNNVGCKTDYFYLNESESFSVTTEILSHIKGKDIVFLCNPNNPTGQLTPQKLMLEIANECKKQRAVLVVDECFMDFVRDGALYSLKEFLEDFDNLIILKAFTKIFAMPGLRLGYCLCSNTLLLERLTLAGQPWSVSTPAQLGGVAACGEKAYIRETVLLIDRERAFLSEQLKNLGIKVFEAHSNFLLFYCEDKELYTKLLSHNILIRRCGNYRGLNHGYYRIAVKDHSDNQRLINALKGMDGGC